MRLSAGSFWESLGNVAGEEVFYRFCAHGGREREEARERAGRVHIVILCC